MELTGAATLRRSLAASASPVVPKGRRMPARVSCVGRGGGGFTDEGHRRYYEAAPRKAVEAVARDLGKLRAMGLVAGDPAKEKILSEATELLLQELNQMKDIEDELKKRQKEAKAAMKALKQQQKEAKRAASMMNCEDSSSSESSESECEEVQSMKMGCVATAATPIIEQSTVMSMVVPQIAASATATVLDMECDKAAMKAMKKMEKEQKKAAKKAMKMKMKKKEKMMATPNRCKDEDSSSCSSESSESECEGEVVRMSRCTTITAPPTPPASALFPIIVPQIPESVALVAEITSGPANTTLCTASGIAVVEKPTLNRIEVCMGGKCKKSGALALLQEFEKEVGTEGAVVGCKCLGKCGLGPNVQLRSEGSAEASLQKKKHPLCIGVGLEDVGAIVAGFLGDGDLGMN